MGRATKLFAKRLKELREAAGLTQEQFAKELKVSRGSISYYEKGERTPDIEFINALYEYFNFTLPIDFILGETDNIKEEHRNMYEFYGLTDKACDYLEMHQNVGKLISAVLSHHDFIALERAYEGIIQNHQDLNYNQLGYASFLISDTLNRIIFSSLESLRYAQFTPEELEALNAKYEILRAEKEELEARYSALLQQEKKGWEKREKELIEEDERENALRYSAIEKIHEKFFDKIRDIENSRRTGL